MKEYQTKKTVAQIYFWIEKEGEKKKITYLSTVCVRGLVGKNNNTIW